MRAELYQSNLTFSVPSGALHGSQASTCQVYPSALALKRGCLGQMRWNRGLKTKTGAAGLEGDWPGDRACPSEQEPEFHGGWAGAVGEGHLGKWP